MPWRSKQVYALLFEAVQAAVRLRSDSVLRKTYVCSQCQGC
jgi:hypothetical protein